MILTCPPHLAFGNQDAYSPINGEVIPKNSKVFFSLNVTDCNFEPVKPKADV